MLVFTIMHTDLCPDLLRRHRQSQGPMRRRVKGPVQINGSRSCIQACSIVQQRLLGWADGLEAVWPCSYSPFRPLLHLGRLKSGPSKAPIAATSHVDPTRIMKLPTCKPDPAPKAESSHRNLINARTHTHTQSPTNVYPKPHLRTLWASFSAVGHMEETDCTHLPKLKTSSTVLRRMFKRAGITFGAAA